MKKSKLSKREHTEIYKTVGKRMNPKHRSRTRQLLSEIFEEVDALGSVYYYRGKSIAEIKAMKRSKRHKDEYRRLKRDLLKLKERKLLEVTMKGEEFLVALTAKGHQHALREVIINCETKLPGGRVCLVSFDIPEDVRFTRSMFRRLLKEAGFKMIQQSLWKSDKDVARHLWNFVKQAGASRWISIFIAEEIDDGFHQTGTLRS